MGTTQMYRTTVVGTGVAGAPFYMRAFWNAAAGSAQQASDAWYNFLNVGASSLRSGYELTSQSSVDYIDPTTGQITAVAAVTPATVTGTSTSDFLPYFTQALMQWRTGVYQGGREIRGRTNVPVVLESNNDVSGTPTAAQVSAWQTRIATLLGAAGTELVVFSKIGQKWEPVASGQCWNQWAVLRSRRD